MYSYVLPWCFRFQSFASIQDWTYPKVFSVFFIFCKLCISCYCTEIWYKITWQSSVYMDVDLNTTVHIYYSTIGITHVSKWHIQSVQKWIQCTNWHHTHWVWPDKLATWKSKLYLQGTGYVILIRKE